MAALSGGRAVPETAERVQQLAGHWMVEEEEVLKDH